MLLSKRTKIAKREWELRLKRKDELVSWEGKEGRKARVWLIDNVNGESM